MSSYSVISACFKVQIFAPSILYYVVKILLNHITLFMHEYCWLATLKITYQHEKKKILPPRCLLSYQILQPTALNPYLNLYFNPQDSSL